VRLVTVNAQLTLGVAGRQQAPRYTTISPGQILDVELVQPDGGQALVVG
jgi:hypothetical protein